jgi:hypothetical protein
MDLFFFNNYGFIPSKRKYMIFFNVSLSQENSYYVKMHKKMYKV